MTTTTQNESITLEICRNTEWLRENAGLDLSRIEESMQNDAADALGSELHDRLNAAGYETCNAKGQRILFHGWNGANTFAHKMGPVGTFCKLTDAQFSEVCKITGEACDAIMARFAE